MFHPRIFLILALVGVLFSASPAAARGAELPPVSHTAAAAPSPTSDEETDAERELRGQQNLQRTTGFALILAFSFIVLLIFLLRQNAKKEQFQQKLLDERTTFFTNITHEFRTPLTVILGFARQLQSRDARNGESPAQIGQRIERQGSQLLEMINQILDISSVRTTIGSAEWRHGDVVAFVRNVVESMRQLALEKQTSLTYAASPEERELDFVPDYVTKIVQNLVSNAIKYTPNGGQVRVALNIDKGEQITFTVADNGKGIPPELQKKIFEPFYVLPDTPRDVGVGIGLYLTHQIVHALHGTIHVESGGRRGTTFTVVLPKATTEEEVLPLVNLPEFAPLAPPQSATEPTENAVYQAPTATNISAPEGAPLVLIVEDNADVAQYVGSLLQSDYRLAYAANGEEGWNQALSLMPDIILSDIMMGGMDGIALCRKIRQTPAIDHTPVVLVTAKTGVATRIEGIQAGANALVTKPFNVDELRATVAHLVIAQRRLQRKYNEAAPTPQDETAERTFSPQEQAFLLKLDDAIAKQMRTNSINIEELASALFMSGSQLRRKLQAITGEKVGTYILRTRMLKAKQLLDAHPEMPMSEIADKCGFYDAAHFSNQFKLYYKMTPTQYRRSPILHPKEGE